MMDHLICNHATNEAGCASFGVSKHGIETWKSVSDAGSLRGGAFLSCPVRL